MDCILDRFTTKDHFSGTEMEFAVVLEAVKVNGCEEVHVKARYADSDGRPNIFGRPSAFVVAFDRIGDSSLETLAKAKPVKEAAQLVRSWLEKDYMSDWEAAEGH